MESKVEKFVAREKTKDIMGAIVMELIFATIWGVLEIVLKDGSTPLAVINIVFLLISLVMGANMISSLKEKFNGFISLILSVLLWFLIFGVYRGLI